MYRPTSARATAIALTTYLGFGALACSGGNQTARSAASTTRAEISNAGSTDLKVVDDTGFVGPAGNTRGVVQGMGTARVGPTQNGSAQPSTEAEGPSAAGDANAAAPPAPIVTSPSDPAEAIERAARAACDRETFCENVGQGRVYGSADACMADKRSKIQDSKPASACPETIRGDRLGACLTAIRATACSPKGASIAPPQECSPNALCAF